MSTLTTDEMVHAVTNAPTLTATTNTEVGICAMASLNEDSSMGALYRNMTVNRQNLPSF